MNFEISLCNRYSPWTEIGSDGVKCWLKGMLFHKNELLQSCNVVHLFSSVLQDRRCDHESLKALLLGLNGNFVFVMETRWCIFCIVDPIRSIPLFYSSNDEGFILSDDPNYLRERLNPPFNEENGDEFQVTGYVTGSETLFEGVSQIQAGEYLIYDKKEESLTTHVYHRFWHENYFTDSEKDLLDRLDETFVQVFQRLIASARGSQIVVPLSGGLDSRIIVAMLKRLGFEDVICFSYGKKGNKEAEISRQVAEALGYRYYFVEYTNHKWHNFACTDEMKAYYSYASNFVSVPHIQDILAVNELKYEGKIPENAVFVPGHAGDMLSGGHIPPDYGRPGAYNLERFLEDNIKKHYSLWKWDEAKLGSLFRDRIRQSVGDISVHDDESCANAIELFDFKERQAKFIVNSVRVYEFYGFKWSLPLWDRELMNYFLKVPFEYRIKQLLYIKYSRDRLFSGALTPLREIPCSTFLYDLLDHRSLPKTSWKMLFTKSLTALLKRSPFEGLVRIVIRYYRVLTAYENHPLAFYGLIKKDEFNELYTGIENINSFLARDIVISLSTSTK